MSAHRIEVTRLDDGQVMVRKGAWRDIFPEERRATWAAWYDEMHAQYRYPGYADMVKALRELA